MKLLSKYNRIYLTASIVVFLFIGVVYYFVISFVLIEQLNHSLKDKLNEIQAYANTNKALLPIANTRNLIVSYKPTLSPPIKRKFSDVPEFVKEDNEIIYFRQLRTIIAVNGHNYEILIREPETETDDLIQLILGITSIIALFFILILFVINRLMLQKMWKPFHFILEQIQRFNLSAQTPITVSETDITEFEDLNKAVTSMSGKVNQEYHSLKNFTENASHEMQTPLAVLNAKLDLLIQNENISEKEIGQLQEMYGAVNKLTRLNKSLLLLTKIENRQFSETESVQLDQIIEEKLSQFTDQINAKNIILEKNIEPVQLKLNHQLAEIVINNLLINAINHNNQNGSISVTLRHNELVISNTGSTAKVDTGTVFERFRKSGHSEGLGLGLAIVKQVCDQYNFQIRYSQNEDRHSINLHF